ncbi:MAG TPA: hypothetical protein VFD58_20400 [Blastocatellia bacterium]|nr:hypothetical protein [Blastocatellia bacterium]
MSRIIKRLLISVFALFAAAAIFTPAGNQGAQGTTPTFNKEVVRIFQKNCQTCHHPGDIGPMSLITYQETRPFAASIKQKTQSRQMPPWKPVPGCGEFLDARQLSNEEIATIAAWVDAGAPEGSPADLPPPLNFGDGWALGTPDLVLTPDADYTPPTDQDMYRCFTIPTVLRGDRYVSAIDVRPGNRRIVHHVIAYLDPTGASVALDAKDPGPGYTSFGGPGFDNTGILGGWAPGGRGYAAGDGNGIKVQNGSRVVIQVHYHPIGAVEKDRTQIGIYFAKTPVRKELQLLPLLNESFTIPAGDKHYKVTASFPKQLVPNAHIVSVTPHMHLLGREIKLEMTPPGQAAQCLINIDDWNFQWQGTYLYKQPVAVPAGTSFNLTSYFDNSSSNPLNPNSPPKPVSWGEATTDEMCIAFIGFTIDALNVSNSSPQLGEVALDQNNNLLVTGSGFLPGADIEINGTRLRDTQAESPASVSSKLLSGEMWRVYAAPGQTVNVTVINPDGVRTEAKTFVRGGTALLTTAVSAANYAPDGLAPEAIAATFGTRLALSLETATSIPLPTTLGGTTVRVNGVTAPLFFAAAGQINFLIPPETQNGTAVIEVTTTDGTISRNNMTISSTAPALFTADTSGRNAPAALATADGIVYRAVGNPDGSANQINTDDYLVLFGTGVRRAASGTVKITIGGVSAPVLYSGAQGDFVGLDQLNTQVPAGVAGLVDLVLTVNGKVANTVKLNVRSSTP